MLQRIETPTGTGIPDIYCSIRHSETVSECNDQSTKMWIETKTTEYKVSNDQLNWASNHWLTGGLTFIVTRINMGQITPKTTTKNPNQTAHSKPTPCSNLPAHALPYPQLPELFVGRYNTPDLSVVSYDQLITSAQNKGKETLIFLPFDDRMRDCSTLGVYLRRHNPDVLPVEHWVRHTTTRLA